MAFSSGASLAATLLIGKQQTHTKGKLCLPFKCAIFFSGAIPVDPIPLLQRSEIRRLDPKADKEIIKIPTAHIWGANDTLYPDFGPVLRDLSLSDLREEFVHQGGHEIPGPKDRNGVSNSLRIIKRTIEKALEIQ
jgi:hypothetical protein